MVTRVMELVERDITLGGQESDRYYRFVPSRVEVTVQGLSEELDSVTEENLGAFVDVEGLGPGLHPGNMAFSESDIFTVVSWQDFQIEVTLRSGVVEAGTQPQESAEPEEESSGGQVYSAREPGLTEPAAEAGATAGAVVQGTQQETGASE